MMQARTMPTVVLLLAALICTLQESAATPGTERTWTDVEGRQITATYISADEEFVHLQIDGVPYRVPRTRLARACRQWVNQATGKPADESDTPALQLEYLELPPPAAIREMVRTVAYELSSSHPGEFRRIARNSTLSIHGNAAGIHKDAVDNALATLEEVLRHTQIRVRRISDNRDADIVVFIGPQSQFIHFARQRDFSYRADASAYYSLRSQAGNITAGMICIDPTQNEPLRFQRTLLHGLLHCLGLRGNSDAVRESVFNREYFNEFNPRQLSPLDKAIAIFCLRNLQPGADMSLFERTFNGRWPEVVRIVLREMDPPEETAPAIQ